jgi:uncharacterized BrkB/YihY/UPF0761 family membrane protein
MSTTVQIAVSVFLLGAAIWALLFLLPRARREQDTFGIGCALLMTLMGLLGWLFIGVGVGSR